MSATVLGNAKTCDTPVMEKRDDNGWLIVVQECGCSRTYGAYQGFGSRNLLHTTVCDARTPHCEGCGRQTHPHCDCVCGQE